MSTNAARVKWPTLLYRSMYMYGAFYQLGLNSISAYTGRTVRHSSSLLGSLVTKSMVQASTVGCKSSRSK